MCLEHVEVKFWEKICSWIRIFEKKVLNEFFRHSNSPNNFFIFCGKNSSNIIKEITSAHKSAAGNKEGIKKLE